MTSQLVRVREASKDETARNEISGCHSPLYFDSTDIWTVLLSLQIMLSEQSRVRYGPMLFDGLPEETCVQSRAETRASIAQDLEGRTGGARDRVVTGLHLGLPYHSFARIAKASVCYDRIRDHYLERRNHCSPAYIEPVFFKGVDAGRGLLYDDPHIVVAVVRRRGCMHHNGLRDRIATRSCRS